MEASTFGRAPLYLSLLPGISRIAREYGYACCVHGSLSRDMDLVMCPWARQIRPQEELIEAIRMYVRGHQVSGTKLHKKPHGRASYVIYLSKADAESYGLERDSYLDISIMPIGNWKEN